MEGRPLEATQPDSGLVEEARQGNAGAFGLLVQRYQEAPPPATFRLIASPLVSWIWIGALIVAAGGAIALWPAPLHLRARARGARAPAAVAGEPERASA